MKIRDPLNTTLHTSVWPTTCQPPSHVVKRKSIQKVRVGHRIEADLTKQAPNNSYSPPLFYEDISFTCRDCDVEGIWTAEQQRLWYEQWGGPIQSTAVRCRACRQRVQREKTEQKKHMQAMAAKKGAKRGG